MKSLTIGLLAIFTLFNISAHAACPNANVTLTSQAQVDAFPSTYEGCTFLHAGIKLKISGAGITNLDSLKYLTAIYKSLDIKLCPDLVDITGLENLIFAGEIDIETSGMLTSLTGLESLTTLGDLEISNCDALTDITALSSLTELYGELYIKENDALVSLAGLHNITSIGDSLVIDGNDLLLNLDGLSGLVVIGSDLTIDNNDALNDMTGLSNLTTIGDDVRIIDNKNIVDLYGFANVTTIGGGLDVKKNEKLADCLGSCEMINAIINENYYFDENLTIQCNDESTLDAECLIFLPVELSDFRAVEDKENKNIELSWTTDSELNNKRFEVERSVNGRTFETIGKVAGQGTTTIDHYYKFVDTKPVAIAYYRLKQVDFSGDFAYSDLVLVKMTESRVASVEAFPTITKNEITIRFSGFKTQKGTFSIFSFHGKLVKTYEVDLSNNIAYTLLDVSKFEEGIYTLVITNNSKHISTNFIVLR